MVIRSVGVVDLRCRPNASVGKSTESIELIGGEATGVSRQRSVVGVCVGLARRVAATVSHLLQVATVEVRIRSRDARVASAKLFLLDEATGSFDPV